MEQPLDRAFPIRRKPNQPERTVLSKKVKPTLLVVIVTRRFRAATAKEHPRFRMQWDLPGSTSKKAIPWAA
jgi:hypothetical protein